MPRNSDARERSAPITRHDYITFGAPRIGRDEIAELLDCIHSGWIGTGPIASRFEALIRDYVGAHHAIAVNSATAALHLSLLATGMKAQDEVITTAMTFCATANVIVHAGATPVLVDCDRSTQLIDPQRIEDALTPRTRAIVPVHFAGRACDMAAIMEIARRHDLVVIEDAAHALESTDRGRKIGSIGHFTCFSFYVTKNITTGEGGMVTTNEDAAAVRIRAQSLHGLSRDAWKRYSDEGYRHYQVELPGFKYNLTDMAAALGIHQFAHIEPWLARRAAIWRAYDEAFADLPVVRPCRPGPESVHAHHLYTLMIDAAGAGITRDQFMAALHARGVGTGVHYVGVHLQPYYRDRFGYRPEDFPNASWISERTVSIPLSPHLSDQDVDCVIAAVRRTVGRS